MKKIAQFEKVSWKQFQKDYADTFGEGHTINMDEVKEIYNSIQLPIRATSGSAGYDFKSPITFTLNLDKLLKFQQELGLKLMMAGC